MKDKVKRFFKNNGFYLLLLGCVVAVFAAGVAILSRQQDDPGEPVIAYVTPVHLDQTEPTAPVAAEDGEENGEDVFHAVTPEPESSASPEPQRIQSLARPLEGSIQVDYSGKKLTYNKTTREWRTHPGVDIAGSDGSAVTAAADGTVSAVKDDPRYGKMVVLDHGSDTYTVYCGFGNIQVKEGAAVKCGDVLGTLGGEIFCEREQGMHLHFEVLVNGSSADPNEYWK